MLLCRTEPSLALRDLSFTWSFPGPRRQVPLCGAEVVLALRCHQHLGQCEPGPTRGSCCCPRAKHSQKHACAHPLTPCDSLGTPRLWLFAQIFVVSTRNCWTFPVGQSLCASRREQVPNKTVQLMPALAKTSFLVSLAAVLLKLLTEAAVEHWRQKKNKKNTQTKHKIRLSFCLYLHLAIKPFRLLLQNDPRCQNTFSF